MYTGRGMNTKGWAYSFSAVGAPLKMDMYQAPVAVAAVIF